jgi:hypothetical protein
MWRENFERCSANSLPFSSSLFTHYPGGVEYLRIGGDVVLDFLLFFYTFPNRVIFPFKIRNVFSKGFIPHFLDVRFVLKARLIDHCVLMRNET